ncbi:hypothetical protein ACVCNH_18835 [Achromobacter anxifer]
MRIAFASCIATNVFNDQPVWDWIGEQAPDHLVLLGDSLYLDIYAEEAVHPKEMEVDAFARHAFSRYGELLHQAQFSRLVKSLPAGCVWTTWDDHDCLWNDVLGAVARESPAQAPKLRFSTALHEAFRRTLKKGMTAGSFPNAYNAPVLWKENQPPLESPSIKLSHDVMLHLADVRSWRTGTWLISDEKRTILGAQQRAGFQAEMGLAPDAIHLFASGSTCADYKVGYAADWKWLLGQAAVCKMLVLSGDIHRNESDAFFTAGWPLHEATSSGAAVKYAVTTGETYRNYGLVDIDEEHVAFSFFAENKLESLHSRKLSRRTWLPV